MQLFRPRRVPEQTVTERKQPRLSTFAIVEVRNDRGSLLRRANVRDLSDDGALLRLPSKEPLPDSVTLFFPADGLEKTAKVRWQEECSAGIEFNAPIVIPERLRSRKNRAEVIAAHFKPSQIH